MPFLKGIPAKCDLAKSLDPEASKERLQAEP